MADQHTRCKWHGVTDPMLKACTVCGRADGCDQRQWLFTCRNKESGSDLNFLREQWKTKLCKRCGPWTKRLNEEDISWIPVGRSLSLTENTDTEGGGWEETHQDFKEMFAMMASWKKHPLLSMKFD